MSDTNQKSGMPEWVPDEYDPDAPLHERIDVMSSIEGGIELHVGDDRGVIEIVGQPVDLNEDAHGNYRMYAGGSSNHFTWKWEIVVPSGDANARLEKANPEQDVEDYHATRRTHLENVDVRMYGVDNERLEEKGVTA